MISRSTEARNPDRIPGMPWQPPRIPDTLRFTQKQGTITESIRGNQLRVSVKLRRTWAVMLGAGDIGEFRESLAFLRGLWQGFDLVVKAGLLLAVAYLAWQILPTFLPGGPAYQALAGF
jgi:hypothetical protein